MRIYRSALRVVSLTAFAAFALSAALMTSATAATALPADPAAHGYIGLCDEAGNNVTGGSTDTKPFAWKVVASQGPPADYQGSGANAILNVYQPRPGVQPSEWSGNSLTAASFYKGKVATVQATYADSSLKEFMQLFPPMMGGLYELRMYFGKANYGLYSATYPVATIRVTGDRWELVSGGAVQCKSAKAVSNEQLTGVVSKKMITPRKPSPAETVRGSSSSPAPGNGGASTSGSGRAVTGGDPHATRSESGAGNPKAHNSSTSSAAPAAAASGNSSGGSASPWPWIGLAVIVALGVAGVVLRKRSATRTRRPSRA